MCTTHSFFDYYLAKNNFYVFTYTKQSYTMATIIGTLNPTPFRSL